jgi:hypothetical protein
MAPSPAPAGGLWQQQTKFLLWKHGLVAKRRWRATLVQLLAPLVVSLVLYSTQLMANAVLARVGLAFPPGAVR